MHEASVVATELARSIRRLWREKRVRIGLAVFVGLFLIVLVAYFYSSRPTGINCAFRVANQDVLPETDGDAFKVNTCVKLHVASTESARVLGLSGRKSMPQDEGLLFDFGKPDEYCMWMKDMHFALDMMWLNEDKEIIYMIENVMPDTYPKSFCGPAEARYVVEVNKDVVKAADLRIGQRLRF